jgi:hypothetical protein
LIAAQIAADTKNDKVRHRRASPGKNALNAAPVLALAFFRRVDQTAGYAIGGRRPQGFTGLTNPL